MQKIQKPRVIRAYTPWYGHRLVVACALVLALLFKPVAALAIGAIGMIIDAQLLYSDAQALTVTAVSTNLIDHGSDRNLGIGEPLAIVVTVDVAAAGGGTLTITLQTDDNGAFSSAATVAVTAAIAAAALVAGAKIVIPVPADIATERFTRLNYALATMTGITVTAFMQPLKAVGVGENVYYADAISIG